MNGWRDGSSALLGDTRRLTFVAADARKQRIDDEENKQYRHRQLDKQQSLSFVTHRQNVAVAYSRGGHGAKVQGLRR